MVPDATLLVLTVEVSVPPSLIVAADGLIAYEGEMTGVENWLLILNINASDPACFGVLIAASEGIVIAPVVVPDTISMPSPFSINLLGCKLPV